MTPASDEAPFIPWDAEPRTLQPTRLSLLALALVAAASLAPSILGAPLIPEGITGGGAVNHIQVRGQGFALEGGAADWSEVCGGCTIRLGITGGLITVYDADQGPVALAPGLYELREYRGLFTYSIQGRHSFFVQVYGAGKVDEIL